MTYWQFHLAFLFPVLVLLLGWQRWQHRPTPPRAWLGIALAAVIALVYTTPWDNYLVWRGVWSYRPERVASAWKIGYVPLEEYLFFVVQPLLTGLCLWSFGAARFAARWEPLPTDRPRRLKLAGAFFAVLFGLAGGVALLTSGGWLYAGLILVWSAPPFALQWIYGGEVIWGWRWVALPALLLSTFYLWIVDRVAIGAGIWHVSPLHSTGWALLGLPVEEALFFAVTNVLIVQTLLLLWQRVAFTRAVAPARP